MVSMGQCWKNLARKGLPGGRCGAPRPPAPARILIFDPRARPRPRDFLNAPAGVRAVAGAKYFFGKFFIFSCSEIKKSRIFFLKKKQASV
jgi:hypothetical protein